jgi:hypothetical protein
MCPFKQNQALPEKKLLTLGHARHCGLQITITENISIHTAVKSA